MPQYQKHFGFLDDMKIKDVVATYSPWLDSPDSDEWHRVQASVPRFRRPVFKALLSDIESEGQIISVSGPRRVGKSTLLRQLVQHLLDKGVPPGRIIYYAFDDPALYRPGFSGEEVISTLMEYALKDRESGPAYLLLDEIQKLDRWELFLKKYYDLHYPARFVISGSASSPIFKKSRESLLGRVKDYHVLPFSFGEFLSYCVLDDSVLTAEVERFQQAGREAMGMLTQHPDYFDTESVAVPTISDRLWSMAEGRLGEYLVDGGFPEVWRLKTKEDKIDYLFNNQVKKVITEDLVLAVELRKPEQLKTFYISLLEKPGCEVNISSLSRELGIGTQQIDKYLPLLQMTDLIRGAGKFRKSAIRPRAGFQKFYPVDLALRNAVLRLGGEILDDPSVMGLYAETLVYNALRKWPGVLQVDYYRESQLEVDFIVHTRPMQYLPVEVKYSATVGAGDLKGLTRFRAKYRCTRPMLVTREREDFGLDKELGVFKLPLILFLLLFD